MKLMGVDEVDGRWAPDRGVESDIKLLPAEPLSP
jgi:hypothetical protein